ncbi:MAG TPA: flavodoxin-dependent (E)-4-hydroxy-3-methylbut-2-enyl-diphosphate synthase [Myxococcota bacterium]|nr:flavodoxin-dependent (E)-4-hydroxy-3-methylbut-2-enyl-diphosphate synthase [Myxococcota bacterium]HRY94410.1 flavodoxin-dependent (E)-4-hydroxy-3-methylbut-2-enyl-diphosphate synthase [Myxococcota bacterium]HSA22799.1 flavodoxin-dependent (E)-4-hydroxy-3-methylbut-2-enyl-diphosphate synthase [Myxococcota bacterium]
MSRLTRSIQVGAVRIGGGAPVSIQCMAKADPADVDTIVRQLREARAAGCDIGRIAVPDLAAARTIPRVRAEGGLPIVADVHFDHRLAVEAARQGADGLRVNPGNLGGKDALRAVVAAAAERGIPIRVGVNSGSMPRQGGRAVEASAERMVETALTWVSEIEALGHPRIKVSMKSFHLAELDAANRRFAAASDVPLHLGVTEAGPPLAGSVRSAAGLAPLLRDGIGETVRVSLSAPPALEVRAARLLLQALGLRRGPQVVSCPTCGRTRVDLSPVAERVEALLESLGLPLTVAVMGCEVNGPGEARAADCGIAFGAGGKGLLFAAGQVLGPPWPNAELEEALRAYLGERARAAREGVEHG